MKKVFEHLDFGRVGHFQSILEEKGIPTTIKNLGASVATGEIPFTETYPELWVIRDEDYDPAIALLEQYRDEKPENLGDWTCPACGEAVEGNFGECWNCQAERPLS